MTNVYRVFSNRAGANHRYLTDKAVRDVMETKGWLAEGDGPDLVIMCAPQLGAEEVPCRYWKVEAPRGRSLSGCLHRFQRPLRSALGVSLGPEQTVGVAAKITRKQTFESAGGVGSFAG